MNLSLEHDKPQSWTSMRQLMRRTLSAALPRRLFLVDGPPRSGIACLTFDDGPHPDYTPEILDRLGDAGIKATFFVVGEQIERFPQLVQRIASEGHVIGHHTWSHSDPARTSAKQLLNELNRTERLLDDLVGITPQLFRPPKGKLTAAKLRTLWCAGQTVVLWNRDPRDYAARSADQIHQWFENRPVRPGDIVLLHDKQPHAAAVLPRLIEAASQAGFQFATPLVWIPRSQAGAWERATGAWERATRND